MRPTRAQLLFIGSALLAAPGCGDSGDAGDADAAATADAAQAMCTDFTSVTIGRCALADDSSCTSVSDPGPRFVAVDDQTIVPMVVGFQGSSMFALAARTSGVFPGDASNPDDNPTVNVTVRTATDEIASNYFNQVLLQPVAGDASQLETLYIFLVLNGIEDVIAGETLTAEASVLDRDGISRCGRQTFVAGPPPSSP